MGTARERGAAAESLAAAYFELIGGRVVSRNVRLDGVEVDLVAREGGAEVIVEVRYRSRSDFGGAALTVDAGKRRRLLRAAGALVRRGSPSVRVDVVAVDLEPDGARVRHYRGAVRE